MTLELKDSGYIIASILLAGITVFFTEVYLGTAGLQGMIVAFMLMALTRVMTYE